VTYEEFVNSRLPALLRYALMLSGDPHTAADIVQETMIRTQLKWRQVNRSDVPERYVRRMLTNIYIDWQRTSWLRRVSLRGTPHEPPPAPDHADQAADRDQVWALLAQLPRRQRAAVVLRYYEGLADQEIADVLGCAVGTVRAHISRALTALRAVATPAHTGWRP
jgi:RNA polymerase sigma-70 factor (sigma-E family)